MFKQSRNKKEVAFNYNLNAITCFPFFLRFHTFGLRYHNLFCKQIGKKFGIHHSHLF